MNNVNNQIEREELKMKNVELEDDTSQYHRRRDCMRDGSFSTLDDVIEIKEEINESKQM